MDKQLIREARERNNLTQEAVAKHLDVSRPTFINYETGRQAITAVDLYAIAELLGIEINLLLPSVEDVEKLMSPEASLKGKTDKPGVKQEIKGFLTKVRKD
jgi:transcriptional regulator with XRE-family HTH domain